VSNFSMLVDAYRALALLSKHPRLDPKRIAVMGFSKGGFVALYASVQRFQRMWGPADVEFAAYMPFYAFCACSFIDDDKVSNRPMRIFHGTADDWNLVAPCREYAGHLGQSRKDVRFVEYEGARHSFDNPLYATPRSFPEAQTTACRLVERSPGEIVVRETGEPFDYITCMKRGTSVAYDPKAHAAALKEVKAFLTATFKLAR
jgi:dienelactone hydrolase